MLTPAKRNRVRIVVKDRVCIGLHGFPTTTYLNSIEAVAKLINLQTHSQQKTHDSVCQQVLSI